jgi:hypothetical protein
MAESSLYGASSAVASSTIAAQRIPCCRRTALSSTDAFAHGREVGSGAAVDADEANHISAEAETEVSEDRSQSQRYNHGDGGSLVGRPTQSLVASAIGFARSITEHLAVVAGACRAGQRRRRS